MIILKLFLAFMQVGLFAFGGGYAALPFIQKIIVEQQHWLSTAEMTDVLSLSQMTPGSIAINAATFVGTKVGSILGAVSATVGTVIPQLIIMLALASFIYRHGSLPWLNSMLKSLKAGVVGLISISTIIMMRESLFLGSVGIKNVNYTAMITFIVGFALYRRGMDLIKLIILSAAMGIGLSFVL